MKVFVAVPAYEALVPQAFPGLAGASDSVVHAVVSKQSSILPHTFNDLYCMAVNEGSFTHFAMHHADIEAPVGWLDTLLGVLAETGADVVSVAVPIKDARGLTSMGLLDPVYRQVKRVTMAELQELPEVFDAATLGHPKWPLAVNTGLWVARLEAFSGFPGFAIDSGIRYDASGEATPWFFPEDWKFSEWCFKAGLKVVATRRVPVVHHGRAEFTNSKAWGRWATDLAYKANVTDKETAA